jgi:hypothetical protein
MVAYIDDFKLMMVVVLFALPLLLFMREKRHPAALPAPAPAGADD